ncbi:hypothetical protein Barb7_03186 [Bacteroidales bacterium Barb7]|nr:hypothetical protein Barb7_03186 [Bacteroidales bacterium Barb7]
MDTKLLTLIEYIEELYLASITTQLVRVTIFFVSFAAVLGYIKFPALVGVVCVLVPFTNVQDTKSIDWTTPPERPSVQTLAVPVPVPTKAHPSNRAVCVPPLSPA